MDRAKRKEHKKLEKRGKGKRRRPAVRRDTETHTRSRKVTGIGEPFKAARRVLRREVNNNNTGEGRKVDPPNEKSAASDVREGELSVPEAKGDNVDRLLARGRQFILNRLTSCPEGNVGGRVRFLRLDRKKVEALTLFERRAEPAWRCQTNRKQISILGRTCRAKESLSSRKKETGRKLR